MLCKPSHMHFIKDCLYEGPAQGGIAPPIICAGFRHNTLHRLPGVVTRFTGSLPAISRWYGDTLSVWIEEHLFRIKTKTLLRRKGAANPVGIALTRSDPRNKNVPVVISAIPPPIQVNHAGRLRVTNVIEQKQFNRRTIFGKDAEVNALRADRGAKRITPTFSVCSDPMHIVSIPLLSSPQKYIPTITMLEFMDLFGVSVPPLE